MKLEFRSKKSEIRMKALFVTFLFFVLVQNISFAQTTFISPGIKLGYQFGKDGGFTFGVEISYTYLEEEGSVYGPLYGIVFDIDGFKGKYDFHLGLEIATPFVGVEVGPTISGRYDYDLGFTTTVYTGFILYPYYRYTYMQKNSNQHQLGTFIKIPIKIGGERFSFGGELP